MTTARPRLCRLTSRAAVILAVGATAVPVSAAQAIAPPPPPAAPAGEVSPTAPAGDAVPTPPAPPTLQSESATAVASAPTTAPPAAAEPVVAPVPVGKTTAPAPRRVRRTVTCRRSRHHGTHARCKRSHHKAAGTNAKSHTSARAAAVTGIPWHQDGGGTCSRWDANNDAVDTLGPGMSLDARTSSQYFAYQPVYFYYNSTTAQWTDAGAGSWMWSYRDSVESTGWRSFDPAVQPALGGSQNTLITRGYYWRVALRYYWYASGAAPVATAFEWIPTLTASFPPSDGFAAMSYNPTSGPWCYAA